MIDSVPILEARGIRKSFPGVKALDGVQIQIRSGRLNALLGENGAGKSTMMNILSGVLRPDEGELLLDGKPVQFRGPREAQDAGIAIIHQELNLVPELSVAENIFLGREPLTKLGTIDYRKLTSKTREELRKLDLDVDPSTPISRLRVGTQQLVEITKALVSNSRVVIMDEPTSALTKQEVRALFRLIHQLKADGVGIVYITHKLDELPEIADDVTVFRDGQFVATAGWHELTVDQMISLMVGRDLTDLFPKSESNIGDEVLKVSGLSLKHPEIAGRMLVNNASLSVRRGEIVGLFGLMGAGRTELLQSIFGLFPNRTSGDIQMAGQSLRIQSPKDAIAAGLALVPEDRKLEGVVLSMDILENAAMATRSADGPLGMLRPRKRTAMVDAFCTRLRVKAPSLSQEVGNLSGGNQQKVVLAKWLATSPRLLMLDEPTRGIDINAKKEIYSLIDELADSGLGVLMVSSELPEILALSDRILVMAGGVIVRELSRAEATEENVLSAAFQRESATA